MEEIAFTPERLRALIAADVNDAEGQGCGAYGGPLPGEGVAQEVRGASLEDLREVADKLKFGGRLAGGKAELLAMAHDGMKDRAAFEQNIAAIFTADAENGVPMSIGISLAQGADIEGGIAEADNITRMLAERREAEVKEAAAKGISTAHLRDRAALEALRKEVQETMDLLRYSIDESLEAAGKPELWAQIKLRGDAVCKLDFALLHSQPN